MKYSGMVGVGYGQQLTQLERGNIQLRRRCILLKIFIINARRREDSHLAKELVRQSLTREEKCNFVFENCDFNELRSEGESGFDNTDTRFIGDVGEA